MWTFGPRSKARHCLVGWFISVTFFVVVFAPALRRLPRVIPNTALVVLKKNQTALASGLAIGRYG